MASMSYSIIIGQIYLNVEVGGIMENASLNKIRYRECLVVLSIWTSITSYN